MSRANSVKYLKLLSAGAIVLLCALPAMARAVEPTVLTTKDGRVQVQLPEGYTEQSPLTKDINLQAIKESNGASLFIVSEHQKDFDSLAAYGEIVRGLMINKLQDGQSDAGEKIEVNGNPAIRYEITGISKGVRLAYLLIVIQTETRFNQVIGASSRADFSECKSEFMKAARSLKEMPAKPQTGKK